MLKGREAAIANATLWEHAVAILVDQMSRLSAEARADMKALMVDLEGTKKEEERKEIAKAMKEILLPELAGCFVKGSLQKSGNEALTQRTAWLGMKIKTLRTERNLTQIELAERSGLPQSHISKLEAGLHSPSSATLDRLAKALKVKVHEIDYENHEED